MEEPQAPIDRIDDLQRQKAIIFSSIDSEISNDSVSEAILDSLEQLEQIYRQQNIQITEWMKDAYHAVALHCSFRRLLENLHPENRNSPAVESILDSRVAKLEMLNSELLTDVLRDCEKGFRVLLSNSDALSNWKEKSQEFKYYALTLTRFFVTGAMSVTEPEFVENKEIGTDEEAEEDEITAESQETMEKADTEMEFLQGEDEAREEKDERAFNEKEGKDRDDKKEVKEDEIRAENQQMMDKADAEVEFLQEEEDRAREKMDEMAPNEKEASSEGKDRVEFEHPEVVGAKGKEIKVKKLLHKAAAPRRHYKRPARIACSDDSDSDIDSNQMDTSEAKQASLEIPLDSSDVQQGSAEEAVSNPSIDEPLEIRSLAQQPFNVKQSLEKAAVSNSSVDESCEIRLDSPKSIDVSPLKIYEGAKFAKRRKKKTWTPEEEDALREGVKKYGVGNWKTILNAYRDMFSERLEVDLKDKWRNLSKWGKMSHIQYQ